MGSDAHVVVVGPDDLADRAQARIADLGKAHGIEANIAYDGLALTLPRRSK